MPATRSIRFSVVGIPQPQGSTKGFVQNGRAIITSANKGLKPWRQDVAAAALEYAPPEPLEGPVLVMLDFYMPCPKSLPKRRRVEPTKKPDLDKLIRGILDALTFIAFKDDSQVISIFAEKHYAYDRHPGVDITIRAADYA